MSDQVKYAQKLGGKKVLIIGGTSGIGFSVAEALIETGAVVILASSKPGSISKAVDRLKQSYPSSASTITGYVCDLGNEDNLDNNVKELFAKTGSIAHIVFTSGDQLRPSPLDATTVAQMKQAGMVRFFAPVIVAKYAAQYLEAGPESSIILTTGAAGEKPVPGRAIISAYSAGLHGLGRALALDLAPIRVNVVSPSAVDTELWNAMLSPEAKEGVFKKIGSALPTGRVAGPEDVAEAYLYLMKDKNVTGSVISTNGGSMLK